MYGIFFQIEVKLSLKKAGYPHFLFLVALSTIFFSLYSNKPNSSKK